MRPLGRSAEDASLRVLHIVSSDAFAGMERHALGLVTELRSLGCPAELACPPSATVLRAEARAVGVPTHPSKSARRRTWLASLVRSVSTAPPAIVHVHDGRAALAGSVLARCARASLVRTQHFVRPASVVREGWGGPCSVVLHRILNRRLDGYIAVSQAVADAARERRETGRAPVAVIPPGVELPDEHAVARARKTRQNSRPPVVASLGRLESERRFDVLLDAIPHVRRAVPGCRFIIAGSGSAETDLRRRACRLGVENAVSWTGWLPGADTVLSEAHVYVNTWPWEGFGMATAEAMAFALPVVAVASGASVELVEEGVTGLLVPGGDPESLAAAITDLITNGPQAAAMGVAARERAVHRYGVRDTAGATLAFYRGLRRRTRG